MNVNTDWTYDIVNGIFYGPERLGDQIPWPLITNLGMKIQEALRFERERFKAEIGQYLQHTEACWGQQSMADKTCRCGLDDALKPKE